MTSPVSPFAPDRFPELPPVGGFTMATAQAGVKYKGRTDLWVLRCDPGTTVAGVFTKNKCPGAPVDWSRKALTSPASGPRLVVVNSGTANVFSGQAGRTAVLETAKGAASVFGGTVESVQIASTGVIGVALEARKLTEQFPDMAARLTDDGWENAARAIMTTDTFPKGATATAKIGDTMVRINGIAKGSGMIAPDMATMLAYIATDATLSQETLQALLSEMTGPTFNSITVDSDTSTSDTLLLMASGASGSAPDGDLREFRSALRAVMHDLAQQIIRDGEGISKLMTIHVGGAVSDASAHRIAKAVADSPLVKTAVAGEDATWGRIIMAVGKAGEPADRDKLTIHMGPHCLARDGQPDPGYREEKGATYMKNSEIDIHIDLGLGEGRATVWGCDLTYRYIEINADYRS